MTETVFPPERGTYILWLHLDAAMTITVGRLGTFEFPAGNYGYVGSAFGRGGLRGRLKHHTKPVTKAHWHIDYLRQIAPLQALWFVADMTVYEHAWAAALRTLPDSFVPAAGFGASDCACETHLIGFPQQPAIHAVQSATAVIFEQVMVV